MAEDKTVGILAYGAYLPRLRLARKSMADANAWFNPALTGLTNWEPLCHPGACRRDPSNNLLRPLQLAGSRAQGPR